MEDSNKLIKNTKQINKKWKTVTVDRVNLGDIIDIFPCIKKLTSLQRKTKSIGQQTGYC